ncbi:MAG: hypothetical protein DMF80_17130 [Acidobacteria bacterium]|nr:MAG: hypothetical protein DMF80_17130 [Acidobacteriota bacterium]
MSSAQPLRQQRLSQERQQQLIEQQRQRAAAYNQRLEQQLNLAQQRAQALEQQRRLAQYRFQEQYLGRLRQQRLALARSYDYSNDPYFYTAPSYGYSYDGRYYETNQYGADLLRQAVRYGYEEGFRAGRADRQDGWRFDPEGSYAYQDANYGYTGRYIDQPEYNYYFREGFRRGYEDGYYGRSQYGRYSNGNYSILTSLLTQILNLRALR